MDLYESIVYRYKQAKSYAQEFNDRGAYESGTHWERVSDVLEGVMRDGDVWTRYIDEQE